MQWEDSNLDIQRWMVGTVDHGCVERTNEEMHELRTSRGRSKNQQEKKEQPMRSPSGSTSQDRVRCASNLLEVKLVKSQRDREQSRESFQTMRNGHGHHSQRYDKQTDLGTLSRKNSSVSWGDSPGGSISGEPWRLRRYEKGG